MSFPLAGYYSKDETGWFVCLIYPHEEKYISTKTKKEAMQLLKLEHLPMKSIEQFYKKEGFTL